MYTGRGTDGTFRLYTRTLDQEQAAPLAGTEGASVRSSRRTGKLSDFSRAAS